MNNSSTKELGSIIREKRKLRKMSQEHLAEILGVTKSTISKYELGMREPSFEQLRTIADALNVDIYELLTGEAKEIYFQSEVDMVLMNSARGYCFTDEESKLVTAFNALSLEGQQKAIERVEELTEIPKYRKNITKEKALDATNIQD